MSASWIKVLAGDEILLVDEAAQSFREHCAQAGYSNRQVFRVDGRSRWDAIEQASQALGLFSERMLLEVRVATTSLGTHGTQALPRLAEQLHAQADPVVALLVRLPQLDSRARAGNWAKALQKLRLLEEVPALKPAQLPGWISQRLRRHGLVADRETCLWIAERVEGNLVAAHQEIEKLALLHPPGDLPLEAIRSVISNVSRYDTFQWRDALLAGNRIRIAQVAQGLQQDGESPVLMLWAITEELRILQALHTQAPAGARSGPGWRDALRAQRIWPAREVLYEKALQRLPLTAVNARYARAYELDRLIKGLAPRQLLPDAWTELLRLGMGFAYS